MKKLSIAIISLLTIGFIQCKKDTDTIENTTINIDSNLLKNNYKVGENIDLQMLSANGKAIDSVQYFLDKNKLGTAKGNEKIAYTITAQKYGTKTLKSIAFIGGKPYESSLEIKVLPAEPNTEWTYTIVNTFDHDIKAYTQGLEFVGDVLIESTGNGVSANTGNKGKSSIRKVDPKTGKVLQITELSDDIFGEGATVLNNKIYQLTYKNNEAYVYDLNTLTKEKTLPYFKKTEGWGLTNDGTNLYMTDGSDKFYKINPADFSMVEEFYIANDKNTIPTVNELEWVDGLIYANFYGSDFIGVFDPKDGKVIAAINMADLKNKLSNHPDQDVLNGIAYRKSTNTFFVTGKNWDKMFEIKINKN